MADVFEDVRNMHKFYGIDTPKTPKVMHEDVARFRLIFLIEELEEFKSALLQEDFAEQVDALIDLIVVASGTLDMMGVSAELHWEEVHKCNMSKEVVNDASESKRGSSIDLKKPEGWEAPDHDSILRAQGWKE